MTTAPSERLIEHALALLVESEVAPPTPAGKARSALQRWRTRSQEHEAAAREAQLRWTALMGIDTGLREHFDQPLPPPSRHRARRKVLLSLAAMLGVGLTAGKTAQWYWRQPIFIASHRTRIAQIAEVRLPDGPDASPGSILSVGASSALDVRLYRHGRTVELHNGEVRFDVAHDPQRPFVVLTRTARIEVLGTVFTVRDRGGAVTIGVERGQVSVQAQARLASAGIDARIDTPPAMKLTPGQIVDVENGLVGHVRTADTKAMSAWREGWLVFEDAPLGEALATVNAYRAQPIVSLDSRVNAMRLTGRFPCQDFDSLLAALPQILPVRTSPLADGRVELHAR